MIGSILVLGASGTLGSAITRYLCCQGYKVIGQYNKNSIEFESINLIKLKAQTNEINLLALKPEVVINCIGCKTISPAMFALNTVYPLELMADCESAGVKKFIHISSVGSFGAGLNAGLADESYPLSPTNAYEVSKAAADKNILSAAKTNMDVLILMPSNVLTFNKANRDLGFLRLLVRFGVLVSVKGRSTVLNFVFDTHIAEYIHDVVKSPVSVVGKRVLNTPISMEFLSSSLRDTGKRIILLRISDRLIVKLRRAISATSRVLPFAIFEKLINKTHEIDSDRVFQTADKFTSERFDSDYRRLDFIEYLK
jgi:nucleoside-diphosphate-sugar epimerase